jgi:hypothetical protein
MRCAPALLLVPALALLACNTQKVGFQLGAPGVGTDLTVSRVKARGGFLDVTLSGGDWSLRTFLPANETCTRVTRGEAAVRFVNSGPHGVVERDGERCQASGIGSLHEWRNRQPRSQSASIIPSGRAEYRIVYEDEEVVFLRGRFPQTGRIGFSSMGDAIAVVPNSAVCQRPIRSGRSTIEFFPGGRNVLTLSSSEGRCPIEGLIRPLAPADVEPAADVDP